MNNACITLLEELQKGLLDIDQNNRSTIDRCSDRIELCQSIFGSLRKLYLNHTFDSKESEINFFKNVKPQIHSELHFQVQIFEYFKGRPKGSLKSKKAHINMCLDKASEFINNYCEFNNYMKLGSTHLDDVYFVMQDWNPRRHSGLKYPSDPEFSAPAEPTWSCLLAAQRIVRFLRDEFYTLKNPKLDPTWEFLKFLDWKGSKTDLVELICALHSANMLSGELKHTFQMAEKAFNIELGNFYRIYSDIKLKKNPTNLLDSLKTAFLERMNKEIQEN